MTRISRGGFSMLLVVLVYSVALLPFERSSEAMDGYLSVQETIALCYTPPHYNWLAASNPEALEYVRLVAADSRTPKAQAYALNVLGVIGDNDDCLTCDRIIHSELSLEEPNTQVVDNAFHALANFSRRKVGNAQSRLEEMARAEYWDDQKFDSFRNANSGTYRYRFHATTVLRAIDALARARDRQLEERLSAALAAIGDKDVRDRIARGWKLDNLKSLPDALDRAAKEPITFEDREHLAAVYRSIDREEFKRLRLPESEPTPTKRKATSILGEIAPSPRIIAENEQKLLSIEASKAYVTLSNLFRDEAYDDLMGNLLDDGRFADPKHLASIREKYIAACQRMRKCILDVEAARPRPEEPSVSVEIVETDAGFAEVITVAWRLPGTEEIGESLANTATEHTVDLKTGTLVVLMKKKAGVWYWNPFGW